MNPPAVTPADTTGDSVTSPAATPGDAGPNAANTADATTADATPAGVDPGADAGVDVGAADGVQVVDAPPVVLPDAGPRTVLGHTPQAWGAGLVRWVLALGGAAAIYALFLVAKGASPSEAFTAMFESALGDSGAIGETLLRATPLLLAALAVAAPARAGLFNIGGEGQLVLGAIGAFVAVRVLPDSTPGPLLLTAMAVSGAAFGAAWAGIAAGLKLVANTHEAITSLLLNYVAGYLLAWLVFEPWKDPASLGQAYSEELPESGRLPVVWGDRVHAGIIVAVLAAVALWAVFKYTRWGFRLRVAGGNPEAARRAGMNVKLLTLSAMLVGGALAGLGGMVEVAGIEGRLRPETLATFGYIGFLASWLGRHHPLKAVGSAALLGGILVSGYGLRISTGLSGAAVTVLMSLVLLAVLGFAQKNTKAVA